MFTEEQIDQAPNTQEFLALFETDDQGSKTTDRLAVLAKDPNVLDSLARSYWKITKNMEIFDQEKRDKLKEDKVYRATNFLIENFGDIAADSIKKLMIEKYGFSDSDVKDLQNSAVLETYFNLLGFVSGSYSDKSVGKVFSKPMSVFKNSSRLDLIREGNFEAVREHDIKGLMSGGA